MPYSLISVVLGLLGLFSAYVVYLKVKASSEGEGRVKEIGDEIHLGAMVFMSAEYKRLAVFCLICILASILTVVYLVLVYSNDILTYNYFSVSARH